MEYIDLTRTLKNKIPVYPNDPKTKLEKIKDDSTDYNLFYLKTGLHSGTHIDSPYHYIENGEKINEIKLERLISKGNVLNLKNKNNLTENKKINENNKNNKNNKNNENNENNKITKNKEINKNNINIENIKEKIVILNTKDSKWGTKEYFTDNYYLSKQFAKILVKKGIYGLCVDTGSVDKFGESKIHKILLKNNIWIVENITNTNQLIKNTYLTYVIPAKMESEASFARIFVKK
ncbi:cyclase family protein [Methanobrevibacter curvatus]|uniref:Kynurenine formamidase n=1 Tax=Methanobrevibacter curvatus TaxID=49547 RepID=A0A166C6P8_9EURY|nr:cyclase family protein [Methanobrevibacter curvatus]KZX11717.1 kynurenine formamidase [Methanobrevibacter curvatus]